MVRTKEEARAYRGKIETAAAVLDDGTALEAIELFPAWIAGLIYAVGTRVRHGENLYRCVQAHTAQTGWEPPNTPALWAVVSLESWPDWVQPTGAHDSYQIGAQVTYNGQRWTSTAANNIWKPGVYGWTVTG